MSSELRVRSRWLVVSGQWSVATVFLFLLLFTVHCSLFFVNDSYAYDFPSPRILPIKVEEIKNSENYKAAVNIMGSPSVSGEVIYLRDIAQISGNNDALVHMLEDIKIGYSPLPGESQTITEDFLRLCIKRERIAIEDIKLNSPPHINVTRKYYEFTTQQLKEAIEDFVENKKIAAKGRIIVDNVTYRGRILLPTPDFSFEVKEGSPLNSSGRKFFNIVFKADGNIIKSHNIAADLKIIKQAVVAVNHIKRGEIISQNNIQIENREIGSDASQIVTDVQGILGKQARIDIGKGEVVTTNSAETMNLVSQGDVVNIVAESDMLRIAVKGVVRDKGRRGELVKVLNISSNKIIYAKIIDSNTVKVEF